MNEKELKEYQKKMMTGAKGTIGLGIVTGVGSGVMGAIGGGVPGAAPAMGMANTALTLANVGNMAAIGMSIMPTQSEEVKKKKGKPQDNPAAFF
jgi:hypothetical protein